MKRIRLVELLSNIRADLVPFLSIALFVALGVGLFLGIQWGGDALRIALEAEIARGHMHDIEVQFPYGLTDEDLQELGSVEGVVDVEPGYSTFATMLVRDRSYSLRVVSKTERMDLPTMVEGNLPSRAGEIALLEEWATNNSVSIGDTIRLKHDATKAADGSIDSDGMRFLTSDTFTVTAIVWLPTYLGRPVNTLGISSSSSGVVDCVGVVTADSFDRKAFGDAYSSAYLRASGAEGLDTFSSAYEDATLPVVNRVSEMGAKRGPARYEKVHGDAQQQLDKAQSTVRDAESQLAAGEGALRDGEQALADGERLLSEGKDLLSEQQLLGYQKLAEAHALLVEGQAKYDAGVAAYNTASELYNQLAEKFDSVRGSYDQLVDVFGRLRAAVEEAGASEQELREALASYEEAPSDEAWGRVDAAYGRLASTLELLGSLNEDVSGSLGEVGSGLGLPTGAETHVSAPTRSELQPGDVATVRSALDAASRDQASARELIARIEGASFDVAGITVSLLDLPNGFDRAHAQLEETRLTLESSKQQLDEGWSQYWSGMATYEEQVAAGKAELESRSQQLEDGKQQIESGKRELKDNSEKLEEGKSDLAEAEERFKKMLSSEWMVLSRRDNGGVQLFSTAYGMVGKIRWALALLFILVGLFVCYSSTSRLVHEQVTVIGTKKSLGFRPHEIAATYLSFSGMSVALGVVFAVVIACVFVQGIMNPILAKQFAMPSFGPYFSMPGLAIMGGIELVLILLCTWSAVHGVLGRTALDLLRGESTVRAKQHIFERLPIWKHLSLFSQTVVNNCVNDPRRVLGTLVGVAGCTALIVVALTLADNVAKSLERQYRDIYDFDFMVYLSDEGGEEQARSIAMALYDVGLGCAPVQSTKVQVPQLSGALGVATVLVPTNERAFARYYHVLTPEGELIDISNSDGVWLSRGYAEHQDLAASDEVRLTELTGTAHVLPVAGVFDFHLIRNEFLMSPEDYQETFGKEPKPNAMLVNSDGVSLDEVRERLRYIEGFDVVIDDRGTASYGYNEITRLLRTVVVIYLSLSAVMAAMVLLNLDIMFVEEKKRELIVLMINGFSVRKAQAYIYRDSIVLTAIGIVIGIVVGSLMGSFTVGALEPEMGFFIKGFDGLAAGIGAAGAAVFAGVALLIAMRRIRDFDLTDVTRF